MSQLLGSWNAIREIVAQAGALAQDLRKNLQIGLKPDGSIVTNADVEVQRFLRNELADLVPGPAFWGEESAFEPPSADGLWVVDPIDGTSNFAFGGPMWGVSVALIRSGELEFGAIALPDLDECYWAARNQGAYRGDGRLPEIPPGNIESHQLVAYCDGVARRYGSQIPGKMRCAGALVVDGTFTAVQRYRGMIGMREKLYDMAAAVLIGQELGAEVRFADGSPLVVADLIQDVGINRPWVIFPKNSGFHLRG